MWLWVRQLGLFVSFLLCGAGYNLLGGPPPLLPGARWPRVWPAVPVCGVLVWRLPGCAVACFGYSFRLGSVVLCCAALCRAASRRAVARCFVARCGALCRAVSRCAVAGQWRSNVETMDPPLHEEEMTHQHPPQQPLLPRRDQRAPRRARRGCGARSNRRWCPPTTGTSPPRTPTTRWQNQVRDSLHLLDVSQLAMAG